MAMKKRRALSVFSLLLMVPAIILLAGYIAWPAWMPPVLRAVLADYDIRLLQADISRPGWGSLGITDVALSYQTADYVITLNSPEVRLNYLWRQLLQGRIERLHMPAARLQLEPATQKKSADHTPFSVPLIFPATLFSQLPVTQVQMDSLELVFPEGADYQVLAGSLHYTAEQLMLNLAGSGTATGDVPNLEMKFIADRQNRLQLNLRQGGEALLNIHSQIDNGVKPAQLRGDLTVDLQAGSQLLKQLRLIDSGYQLTGEAQLHWQGPLPETIGGNALQELLLTAELSSHGSISGPHIFLQPGAEPAQFDITAHFQLKDEVVAVSFPEFNLKGVLDLSHELVPWLAADSTKALPAQIKLTPDTQLRVFLAPLNVRMEQGAAELSVGHFKKSLFAQLQLQSLSLQAEQEWRAQGQFKTQVSLNRVNHPQLSAKALAFSGAGQASFDADVMEVQFDAGSLLQGESIRAQQGQLRTLNLKIPAAFQFALQDQKLTLPELELQVGETQLAWHEQAFQFAEASLQLKDFLLDWETAPKVTGDIETKVTGIQVATGDLQLKPVDLNGSWQLTKKALLATVQLKDAAGLLDISSNLKHELNSGKGYLKSQLQALQFRQHKSYLPNLFEVWPYPVDVFAGQMNMTSTLSWDVSQESISAWLQGRAQLKNVAGFYDTNLFHGLNTELVIDAPLTDLKVVAEQFKIDRLEAGVPINNVTFSLQSTPAILQIKDFQAELLGGQVSQKLVSYDWTQNNNELLLQLQGIQLSELLRLEEGIEGYGVLDGQLPIRITQSGMTMTLGQVQARSPGGVIKYAGGQSISSAAANFGVGFALDALRNFHYDALDVKVDYAEDGELQLQAALLGRNPDMGEQRPVRFNINIKENIPALVRSLKLTQDISDDIERRLKTFYE